MDGIVLGERIALARGECSITQEELASRIGIERTALGRIEKGERKVSAVELVSLSVALGVPLAWFVRDPLPAVVSRRTDAAPSHKLVAQLDRQVELFAGDVESLLATGVIAPVRDRHKWRTPRTHQEAEQTAIAVRAYLDLEHGPLLNVAEVAELFGLYTCSLSLGGHGADGALVEVSEGAAAAVVDGDARPGRRRMSVAHELGHWLFGDSYDRGADDAEKKINSFAAYLLAPRTGVVLRWNQHVRDSLRDRVIRIAAEFRMSWSAVVLHLRNLELIDDEEYRTLKDYKPVAGEFAKLGITVDVQELEPPLLSPGIAASILQAYVDRQISAARTVELLRGALDADDLPEQRLETGADYASQ